MSFKKLILVVTATLTATFAVVSLAQAANLASYRAVYNARLSNVSNGANVTAVTGQIAYGAKRTCGAWLVNQAGGMYFQTTTGDVIPQPLNYSSWESEDGLQFRFSVMGDEPDTTILGGAKRTGLGGEAQFTKPEPVNFTLPEGTIFPFEHTAYILDQAQAGHTQFENYVFDGTDVEGAKLLVTFVTAMSGDVVERLSSFSAPALKKTGWNFRMAYFDPAERSSVPIYEIEADFLDNGIPVRWVMDYGDFAIELRMEKFESLPDPNC
ncbi:MAG: cell envelope integrity EipB family protein [Magnetovibrio sp.]|nr:cell envelope integrity EipB family protein [Magnetovibrio sp.]